MTDEIIISTDEITFADLPISAEILKAVEDMGYITPSPIQAQAISLLAEGRDVIGQAQTGTGKTAAFGIPLLDRIDPDKRFVQGLVLCPTRELAEQVAGEFKKLSKHKKGIRILPIYGGTSIERQIKSLRDGVHVVVGTPGRVIDHIDRGTLKLGHATMAVLDEADEMLNMGFRDDIESILSELPEERQSIFFSATMSKDIMTLANSYQTNPQTIKVDKKELTVANIEQFFCEVRGHLRTEAMLRLMDMHGLKSTLVFCNTKKGVDDLVESFQSRRIQSEGLHGDMKQQLRNNTLNKFKSGVITVLVATDVAARGIDVESVDSVFNFDVPLDEESYVHRIGRTGRAGRKGKAFTFVSDRRDAYRVRDIERYIKTNINKLEIPDSKSIKEFREQKFADAVKEAALGGAKDLKHAERLIERLKEEGLTDDQIALGLAGIYYVPAGKDYRDEDFDPGLNGGGRRAERGGDARRSDFGSRREAPRGGKFDRFERKSGGDRFAGNERGGDRRERGGAEKSTGNYARVMINVGRRDNVRPGDLVGAIAGESGINGGSLGRIEIQDSRSYVDIPPEFVEKVIRAMNGNTVKGVPVSVEPA